MPLKSSVSGSLATVVAAAKQVKFSKMHLTCTRREQGKEHPPSAMLLIPYPPSTTVSQNIGPATFPSKYVMLNVWPVVSAEVDAVGSYVWPSIEEQAEEVQVLAAIHYRKKAGSINEREKGKQGGRWRNLRDLRTPCRLVMRGFAGSNRRGAEWCRRCESTSRAVSI